MGNNNSGKEVYKMNIKILKTLSALMIAMSMFTFASCGNTDNNTDTDNNKSQTTQTDKKDANKGNTDKGTDGVIDDAKDGVKDITDGAGDAVKDAGDMVKDAGDTVTGNKGTSK